MSDLTRLNPTPHAIAVYASQPLSPVATQHSLPSRMLPFTWAGLSPAGSHQLCLAHSFDHLRPPGSAAAPVRNSFDDLVGAHEDCFGNGDPQGFRGLEVHNHLEPSWALDGEVGWLGTAQNPRDVTAATAKHIGKVRPIGNKTSSVHVRPVQVYRREASFRREFADPCSVSKTERIGQNDESVGAPLLRRVESAIEVRGVLRFHGLSLKCEGLSYLLQFSKLWCIDVGVSQDRDASHSRYDLLKELQMLSAQLGKIEEHSSNVASWPRDTRYQSRLNRIDFEVYPHDWDGARRVFGGSQGPGAAGENHIDFKIR